MQWDRHPGCQQMLCRWLAERRVLKVQGLDRWSRRALEEECHTRFEACGRYHVAKLWHRVQATLRDIAPGIAQWAGQAPLECEWRTWVGQEGHAGWVAIGVMQSSAAELLGREGMARASVGEGYVCYMPWSGVRDTFLTHMHIKMMNVRSICHVLRMESHHRASMTARLLALHGISIRCMAPLKALVMKDPLHRNMHCAAARRDFAHSTVVATRSAFAGGHTPLMNQKSGI